MQATTPKRRRGRPRLETTATSEFITPREAAAKLNVSRRQIYRLIDAGKIRSATLLGRMVLSRKQVDDMIGDALASLQGPQKSEQI